MKLYSKMIYDKRYVEKIRHYIDSYKKSRQCEICGEGRAVCLDFHHRDRGRKKYAIGRMAHDCGSMPKVKEEISKCMIVCANCHRVLHADEKGDNTGGVGSIDEVLPLFD